VIETATSSSTRLKASLWSGRLSGLLSGGHIFRRVR
jgi:hypothetical protein